MRSVGVRLLAGSTGMTHFPVGSFCIPSWTRIAGRPVAGGLSPSCAARTYATATRVETSCFARETYCPICTGLQTSLARQAHRAGSGAIKSDTTRYASRSVAIRLLAGSAHMTQPSIGFLCISRSTSLAKDQVCCGLSSPAARCTHPSAPIVEHSRGATSACRSIWVRFLPGVAWRAHAGN